MYESIVEGATKVLRENDRGRHTVPSGRLYPHLWAWDSAFAAIGWSTIDVGRAMDELESLFASQWEDGRIPHIAFDETARDYFPGPDFWECERTSSITNPPVWATALRILLERGAERSRVAALVPRIEASLQFFTTSRDPLGWGGVAVAHPWESGRDNCPAWDAPLSQVDPFKAPEFERVDVAKVGDPGQRPTDDQYKRYAVLVKSIAADGFGPGPFAVYDPFMTALLVRAETDLALIRDELGQSGESSERRGRALECLERMWSPERGRYAFYDVTTKRRFYPEVLAAYVPSTVVEHSRERDTCLAALERRYRAQGMLPTVSPGSHAFDPQCYWRGPAWVSMNWLFATSLVGSRGRELSKRVIDTVSEYGFWEYFDARTGQGLGTDRFTWSAALALDLAARHFGPAVR